MSKLKVQIRSKAQMTKEKTLTVKPLTLIWPYYFDRTASTSSTLLGGAKGYNWTEISIARVWLTTAGP
jgi:hypothetical protein